MNPRFHGSNVACVTLSVAGAGCIACLAASLAFADQSRWASTAVEAAPRLHANAEHPAVVQWRRARAGQVGVNAEHFLVLPPASTQWARQSSP